MAKRKKGFEIFVGESKARGKGIRRTEPTFEEALQDLWQNAGPGEKTLHVLEIEIHGSNPIDMFRVIGTSH